jgi:hypothetical protein
MMLNSLSHFERFMLAQPVEPLGLPELRDPTDVDLWERAFILGYGCIVPRGEENLRRLAITSGILPASEDEVRDLEMVGY